MALYLGKDLVSASSGLGGATIKNQDKTFTENGSYSADSGYTGLGVVKVDVQPKNQDKNITANGTYRADSGYTGLGEVVVDVPPTPPNNQDITVTENGTYTAENGYTGLGTVTVDVPTGGASVSPKDVNFYDYDGTILHSYTVAEAQALTELPELPEREGLICQGWNWTLDEIKAHNRALNVGAMYITDDGKTRLYIKIAAEGRMTVPLYFNQTVANGVTIDWGDGTATETLSGTGNRNTTHTYASIGDYVISLDVAESCTLRLGGGSSSYCVIGTTANNGMVYCNMLKKVEIGSNITRLGSYAFNKCYSLASITVPNSITGFDSYAFNKCYSLSGVVASTGDNTIAGNAFYDCYTLAIVALSANNLGTSNYAFYNCYSLASVVFPDAAHTISANTFYNCYSLASIVIPTSVRKIEGNTFGGCYGMRYYDFTACTSVPTLENTYAFSNIPSDCQIRVPASLYDEWIAATNWSTYASNIVAV